ncbi:MAG: RDD family protein [Pseudobdellovibrio sp.]|nr:RDD family protein [Pseudobdellovibrio sp.]
MIIEKNQSHNEIEKTRVPKKDSGRGADLTKSALFRDQHIDFDLGFLGGPQKRTGFRLSIWMWLAATIDTLVVLSVSCFFMLCYSLMMKLGLRSALGFTLSHENVVMTFSVFFLFSGWMYFIAMRALTGSSIGEKTCSLRLGQPHERVKRSYLARVVIRTTLTLFTGIITLPLLSLAFKTDIVGHITGLNIYSLK